MRNIPEELNIKQQHSQHLNPIKHNLWVTIYWTYILVTIIVINYSVSLYRTTQQCLHYPLLFYDMFRPLAIIRQMYYKIIRENICWGGGGWFCNTSILWWPISETCLRTVKEHEDIVVLLCIDWDSNCIHAQRDGNSRKVYSYHLSVVTLSEIIYLLHEKVVEKMCKYIVLCWVYFTVTSRAGL
jgi:hypothetical protein